MFSTLGTGNKWGQCEVLYTRSHSLLMTEPNFLTSELELTLVPVSLCWREILFLCLGLRPRTLDSESGWVAPNSDVVNRWYQLIREEKQNMDIQPFWRPGSQARRGHHREANG